MKHFLVLLINTVSFLPVVLAQGEIGEYHPPSGVITDDTNLPEFLDRLAGSLLSVALVVAVIMFLIGGIQYSLSAGEESRRERGKRIMKWTAFGLILALSAYAIVRTIAGVLG